MSLFRSLLLAALMISVPTIWGCDQDPNQQPAGNDPTGQNADDDDDDWGDDDDDDWSVPAACQDALDTADACWDGLSDDADAAAEAECEALDDILFDCIDANE
jgi:hypothetical protein